MKKVIVAIITLSAFSSTFASSGEKFRVYGESIQSTPGFNFKVEPAQKGQADYEMGQKKNFKKTLSTNAKARVPVAPHLLRGLVYKLNLHVNIPDPATSAGRQAWLGPTTLSGGSFAALRMTSAMLGG